MNSRLPVSIFCALALHAGAGAWLATVLRDQSPATVVDGPQEIELELTALEEPVPVVQRETPPELKPPPVERPPEPASVPEPTPVGEPVRPRDTAPTESADKQPPPQPEANLRPPSKRRTPVRPSPGPQRNERPPASQPRGLPGGGNAVASQTTGPVCVSRPEPAYPAALLNRRIGGTVTIEVFVDANGRVTSAAVMRSSGQAAFDSSAASGVRRWRFRPAMQAGVPVPSRAKVNIVFRPK